MASIAMRVKILTQKKTSKKVPFPRTVLPRVLLTTWNVPFTLATLSRPAKTLFDSPAELKLSTNRIYGLLGPNGCGKSSLLLNLAAPGRFFPGEMLHENPNLVLLVEQESGASETRSVLEEVLLGDRELSAWEEEEKLLYARWEEERISVPGRRRFF